MRIPYADRHPVIQLVIESEAELTRFDRLQVGIDGVLGMAEE